MTENHYWLNPETLEYEKISNSRSSIIKKILFGVAIIGLLIVLIGWGNGIYYKLPKYKMLEHKQQKLLSDYKDLQNNLVTYKAKLDRIQQTDDNIYRSILDRKPIPTTIRQAGIGGTEKYKHLRSSPHSELLIESSMEIDKILRQLYIQSKSYDDVVTWAQDKNEKFACYPAVEPMNRKDFVRISDRFGVRHDPFIRSKRVFHHGIDYAGQRGMPIYATAKGIVIKAANSRGGYGNEVLINHGNGLKTRYAHMETIHVKKGDKIDRGQQVGTLGSTGRSTGPHLHYEIIKNNRSVNPEDYFERLTNEEYDEMVHLTRK